MKKILMATLLSIGMALPLFASSLPVTQANTPDLEVQPDVIIIIHKKNGQVVGVQTINDGLDCAYVLTLNNGTIESEFDGCTN